MWGGRTGAVDPREVWCQGAGRLALGKCCSNPRRTKPAGLPPTTFVRCPFQADSRKAPSDRRPDQGLCDVQGRTHRTCARPAPCPHPATRQRPSCYRAPRCFLKAPPELTSPPYAAPSPWRGGQGRPAPVAPRCRPAGRWGRAARGAAARGWGQGRARGRRSGLPGLRSAAA